MQLRLAFMMIFLTGGVVALAQSNTCLHKMYAFSRGVLQGAAPTQIEQLEDSKPVTIDVENNTQYFLYITTCATSQPTITAAYINGKTYSAKVEKARAPIVHSNENSPKSKGQILVPKTASLVWEIHLLRDETILEPLAKTQSLIKANAVVLSGYLQGKWFTSALKNIAVLEPVAMQ